MLRLVLALLAVLVTAPAHAAAIFSWVNDGPVSPGVPHSPTLVVNEHAFRRGHFDQTDLLLGTDIMDMTNIQTLNGLEECLFGGVVCGSVQGIRENGQWNIGVSLHNRMFAIGGEFSNSNGFYYIDPAWAVTVPGHWTARADVPEPSTLALLLLPAAFLLRRRNP